MPGFLVSDHPVAGAIRRVGRPIRTWLRRHGLDIVPSQPAGMADIRQSLIDDLRIDLVVDAGANEGQYAQVMRRQGYAGPMLSIEPTASAFRQLSTAAAADPGWTCTHCALGDAPGMLEINVVGNSYSSSFLSMLPTHTRVLPESRRVAGETTRVERLDNLIALMFPDRYRIFLKADVQGFEDRVIAGASGILERILLLEMEVTFAPLYEGQALFPELHATIVDSGFTLAWIEPGFRDDASHMLLQADALYVRRDTANRARA